MLDWWERLLFNMMMLWFQPHTPKPNLNPESRTCNPRPETQNPKPETLNLNTLLSARN